MKTVFFLVLVFLMSFTFANKAISKDTSVKEVKIISHVIDNEELDDDDINDILASKSSLCAHKNFNMFKKHCCKSHHAVKTLPLSNKLLVLSPLFVIGLILLILCILLKRSGFSLTHALSSKRTNEQGQVEFLPSSSKLLAFISILVGIIFIAFFFTFYFFMAFKRIPLPNFLGLWPIVFIIGLGILPYIVQTIFKK